VVEDDEAVRLLLHVILQRDGYEVTATGDGAGAVEALGRREFDVILLDLMLPRVSGFDVLDHLASLERKPRVVIVTAASERQLRDVHQDWVYAIVRKPFDLAGFRETVAEAARG
jgi:CheY-like chemotaxis protein